MAIIQPSADVQAFWRVKQAAESGQAKAQYSLGLMYANGVGVAQDFALALHWYKKSAHLGYSPAQYILAGKYANGQGVERDTRQALNWYLKASDHGNSRALFKLGQMLSVPQEEFAQNCYRQAAEKGVVEAQVLVAASVAASGEASADPAQGFAWYEKAAESGFAAAQYIVGTYWESGKVGQADIQQALAWYRKAARQGFAPAQTQLGLMYLRGEGVPKDNKQAWSWIVRAAEQGDSEACYQLGLMYEQGIGTSVDLAQAEHNYLKAAENGDVRAQLKLAACCAEDRVGLAVHWYEQAAQSGNATACLQLARFYAAGKGVAKNTAQALAYFLSAAEQGEVEAEIELAALLAAESATLTVEWYQRAAEKGHPAAQYQLARCLQTGHGVAQNDDLANAWFRRAAESGVPDAQYVFARHLLSLDTPDAQAEAIAWLRKAAKHGLAQAQSELGRLYVQGHGVPRDNRQAAAWLMKAAEQNDPAAQFALGELFAQGASLKHAEYWYKQAIEQGGEPAAMLALANLYRKSGDALAEAWLFRAAEGGLARAQAQLGDDLLARYRSSKAAEAVDCYIKAAAQGDAEAMRTLAQLSMAQPQLFVGALQQMAIDAGAAHVQVPILGVENRSPAALPQVEPTLDDYLAAANQGDPLAQWHLGEIYAKGLNGVAVNSERALSWYAQAAESGFAAAQAALAIMLASGIAGPRDEAAAVRWWQKAAEQGDPESQYNLSLMYEKGQGVAQDFNLALHWLRKSAEQGISVAQTRLGLSCVMGRGGEPDLVEAYVWFVIAAMNGNNEVALANRRHAETLMSPLQIRDAKRRIAELIRAMGK